MLSRLVRYRPILRLLRQRAPKSILEIGSGAVGLGEFWHGDFVGVDLRFDRRPQPPLAAVRASATALPFADSAFDLAICVDVLEHIPPERRAEVVREAVRVTRGTLVLGFPSGRAAEELDADLGRWYSRGGRASPAWLEEHFAHRYPDGATVEAAGAGRGWTRVGNENLRLHGFLVRWEESPALWIRGWALLLRKTAPRAVGWMLERVDRPPFYRELFVLSKEMPRA